MANTVGPNAQDPMIRESNRLYEKALDLIPSVTQTLAKGPQQYINGVAPKYLKKGKGARVWDVDGNEFIDWTMGVGPLVLGYCTPEIDEAIRKQLEDGITFSLMHPLEVEVAELIRKHIPNAESIRYSKTGADATSAAIRVARAFTGRDKILCCGYHGWHDFYISVTDRNRGIPKAIQELSYTINYNDLQSLEDALDDTVAAVILEPLVVQEPKADFLKDVKRLCEKNGTLLIFDEMWTGFRIAMGGAQEYYGVKPDLATYSKAVANGMPLSVLTGRRDVMKLFDKDVFFYTTFGGEALSLAAAKATIQFLEDKKVPQNLHEKGKVLREGYNKIAQELDMPYTQCIGLAPRTMVTFTNAGDAEGLNLLEVKSFWQQEMIRNGILTTGFHNMAWSHTDQDIQYTLKVYGDILPKLKKAVSEKTIAKQLRGEPVQPVFRKTTQFHTKPKASVSVHGASHASVHGTSHAATQGTDHAPR